MNKTRPKISFDVFELECKIVPLLKEMSGVDVEIKSAETWHPYTPTGDYVITDKSGHRWGIERKSFLDCISSIRSKRVYKQLEKLNAAYPGRAILLVEEAGYIPKKVAKDEIIKNRLKESVNTFCNEQSAQFMIWRSNSPQYTARFMVKWAKHAHKWEVDADGHRHIAEEVADAA